MVRHSDCGRCGESGQGDVMHSLVDTLSAAAVDTYYADRRASVMPFYLYYKVGALTFAPDCPDTTWTLAESQAHRGALSRNALFNHVRTLAGRLPILEG